ncbi:MaoC family dehydratase [Streptomyces sp. NBC_01304]|uniref:MaoC family dehydratase n=1 Tax=Streptomyces sp. NBC_01304 TaxID=2903818 RepID=UPI002E1372F4|nr:MaoC/PaaZ C-terminal domain-containing protein [Streptomyces sp. NBC_01304]
MTVVRLTAAPRLTPLLLRGAALSPLKRVKPDATAPDTRLVLPDAPLDARRLAAYRRICEFPAQGPLPVTYPHILGFPLAMRLMAAHDFPLPLLGLVHTSIEIDQRQPLEASSATLELTVYAAKLAPHHRGTEATLVTEARLLGDLVWSSRSTYLARHRTSTPRPEETRPNPLPARAEWRLPGDLGRRYGSASGDRNPIHLHPLTAKAFGFPRAIAHGMWTVARCLAEQGAEGPVRVRADFKAPVLLPGTVTYSAEGGAFELRGGKDGGRLHLTGEVSSPGS